MKSYTLEIAEILMQDDQVVAKIRKPGNLLIHPGQYMTASMAWDGQPLPIILFPVQIGTDHLELIGPIPDTWQAGGNLAVRGPQGHGFKLPATARRVGLVAVDQHALRLMPIAELALQQGAEVVLYTDYIPDNLPRSIELLPLDKAQEAVSWADYLALDISMEQLKKLGEIFLLQKWQHSLLAEVLVHTPMPCGGIAHCGICSVPARKGKLLACLDGPVFSLDRMEIG